MYDVDEVIGFHRGDQEPVCWGVWFVHVCPLHAEPKGFVLWVAYQRIEKVFTLMSSYLPSHEANCFNNGRLDDFLTREDTPGKGVWPLTVCIRSQITALVDCIVRDEGVTFNLCQQRGQAGGRCEELQVRLEGRGQDVSVIYVVRTPTHLLVDVAITGAPSMDSVVACRAVDGWLRVNGKETQLVETCEVLRDNTSLRSGRVF